jgi:hypothetical protein
MSKTTVETRDGSYQELSSLAPDMPEILKEFVNYGVFSVQASPDGLSCRVGHLQPIDSIPRGSETIEERDFPVALARTADEWITRAYQNLKNCTSEDQLHQLDNVEGVVRGVLRVTKRAKTA